MIYCGLKLTHDSTIAVFDDRKLLFSIELEKVNNNNRYKIIEDYTQIEEVLNAYGFRISDIDRWIVDGWVSTDNSIVKLKGVNNGIDFDLNVAPYHESDNYKDVLSSFQFDQLKIGNHSLKYASYMHASGHIFSAYCTSSFSMRREDSYILVWDGGMYPRLYFFDASTKKIRNMAPLFKLGANVYSMFLQNFGPFKINENVIKDELSIAGKIMAYVAYGQKKSILIDLFESVYNQIECGLVDFKDIPNLPIAFSRLFKNLIKGQEFADEDIITSFHYFIEKLLVSSLSKAILSDNTKCRNLCISGGAGLNIKWNNAIRQSGIFSNIWVPPFPNDSGSAIGAVCSELVNTADRYDIEWNVYSGPHILAKKSEENTWFEIEATTKDLAEILFHENEPVMVLNSRAELGPRALGHRSIIAPATLRTIKDDLNKIKYREDYRPIAPICLEHRAPTFFEPGCSDPYMLFEHSVRKQWTAIFPGICHYDGTARLQTVSQENNTFLFSLLSEYERLSGYPILCNTSANKKGRGFFPDLESAFKWNRVNHIWSNGVLYTKSAHVFQKIRATKVTFSPCNAI